jgi:hypothetical protein
MGAAENPPTGPKSLTPVLVPVAGVAILVVIMIVVGSAGDTPSGTNKAGKDGKPANPFVSGPGKPMSDGSNGGTDDPDLKPIGSQGLKYRELREGTGEACPKGATVEVHYAGWLTDGKQFDSSRKYGPLPMSMSLGRVVAGWQQGIPGMKAGGIRKLVIPSDLGYQERGSPPDIPGGATLIFEIEMANFHQ